MSCRPKLNTPATITAKRNPVKRWEGALFLGELVDRREYARGHFPRPSDVTCSTAAATASAFWRATPPGAAGVCSLRLPSYPATKRWR